MGNDDPEHTSPVFLVAKVIRGQFELGCVETHPDYAGHANQTRAVG
jgi:hypothetical protein